jgi:hypothetical protein
VLKGLAIWVENKTTFVVGTTLFAGQRPQDKPDRCALIAENGGGDTNFWTKDMKWVMIQVVTRGEKGNYFTARDDAQEIDDVLHGAAGIEFGTSPDIFCATITGVNPPQFIGEDDARRPEFSTNYRVAVYKKNGT